MTTDQRNSLLQLFAAQNEGTITSADHQKLQTLLRSDREARELWFLHHDVELGLKRLTQVTTFSKEHQAEQPLTDQESIQRSSKLGVPSAKERHRTAWGFWHNRSNQTLLTASLLCLMAMVMFRIYTGSRVVDDAKPVESIDTQDLVMESPTHGNRFALAEAEGKIVALHFLLKTECPFCLKLIHDYSQISESDPNVVHLFLKPDSSSEIIAWAKHINLNGLDAPPVVFRDPDGRLAKQYRIPDGYQFHGQSGHYPALVALDPNGKELFRYVGKNNTDRMRPADFHARLATAMSHN